MEEERDIHGVKYCISESQVNAWIESNTDKRVIDVKLTSGWDQKTQALRYGCLILWTHIS